MHIIHCTIISNNWNIFYKCSTGYNYFAGVIVITLVAAVIALAVTLGVEMGKDTNQMGPGTGEQTGDDVCLTDGCIQLSAQIAASMNQSVDPCEDFYEFSCGNWIRNNVIDPGKNLWCHQESICMHAHSFKICIENKAHVCISDSLFLIIITVNLEIFIVKIFS